MSESPSATLTFMMGEFKAEFPTDRMYAKNHMWAGCQTAVLDKDAAPNRARWRFGFTAYAVRLLQDVYFLDWGIEANATLIEKQEIGEIESKKAESALYSPVAGLLTTFNETLLSDPSYINVSTYDEGWLFEMECGSDGLMPPDEYIRHLEEVWELTQRTIKGQLN